jgi:hypothetical protein
VFNAERCFDHHETLEGLGITCARLSDEMPVPPIFYSTMGGFEFEPMASAGVAPGFAAMGQAHAGVKLTANAEHACLIQMLNPTERRIENQRQVEEAVLARLRDGQWSVDWQVVMRRTRCTSGFAAVSKAGRQSVEFTTGATLPGFITEQNLPGLELKLTSGRSSSGFLLSPFTESSTPAFGGVVGVKRGLWDRLLPWRSEDGYLVDPNGKRFLPQKLPPDLSAYAHRDRCYDPARSVMPFAELSSLTVEDIFEEVTALSGESELGRAGEPVGVARESARSSRPARLAAVRSFLLPRSLVPSTLAAADDEGDASVLMDAVFEDGLVRFSVYDRGSGRYWLEVALRSAEPQPSVVTVRYQAADGTARDLMIPVIGDGGGRSSSIASLPGYEPGTDGQAWLTAPGDVQAWPAETIRTSVLAAAGSGTARAWERLAALVPARTREAIEDALRVLRGTS